MSYTIESIAECIGARRVGECEATIDWLLTDSRSLSFPEETLFFALTTKRNSGARYIPDLYDRGVRNFVVTDTSFLPGSIFRQFTKTGNSCRTICTAKRIRPPDSCLEDCQ